MAAPSQEDYQSLRDLVLNLQQQLLDQSLMIQGGQQQQPPPPPPAEQHHQRTLAKCTARFSGEDSQAVTFRMKVDDYRTAEDVTDDAALKSIALLLDGAALAWWHTIRDSINTWADFEAAFRERFLPKVYDYKITEQISSRFQTSTETVAEYVVIIRSLYQRMAHPPAEEEQVQHIFDNLRPEYKNHMPDDIVTFDELCKRGRRAEVVMEGVKRYKTAHHKKTDVPTKPATSKGAKPRTPDGRKTAATSSTSL